MRVWVAMLGFKPGTANRAMFGDTKGVYLWVAGRAHNEADFRQLIDTETSRRGLSLDEVSDVMLADDAMNGRRGAEVDWEALVAGANASPMLFMDSTFFFYEEEGD